MSDDKSTGTNPADDDGQIRDEQLEEVAGGTGCVYIPPTTWPDPIEPGPPPTKPINPWFLFVE